MTPRGFRRPKIFFRDPNPYIGRKFWQEVYEDMQHSEWLLLPAFFICMLAPFLLSLVAHISVRGWLRHGASAYLAIGAVTLWSWQVKRRRQGVLLNANVYLVEGVLMFGLSIANLFGSGILFP